MQRGTTWQEIYDTASELDRTYRLRAQARSFHTDITRWAAQAADLRQQPPARTSLEKLARIRRARQTDRLKARAERTHADLERQLSLLRREHPNGSMVVKVIQSRIRGDRANLTA